MYARAAVCWGAPSSLSAEEKAPELTPAMLSSRLASPPTDASFHYAPTNFAFDETLSFMPHRWDTRWYALQKTLQAETPPAAMCLVPFTYAMGPIYREALKRRSIIVPYAKGNTPLNLEVLRQIGQGVLLVATLDEARTFLTQLPAQTLLSLKALHLLVEPAEAAQNIPYPVVIYRDLHLMPALSVAWQCTHLAALKKPHFHPSASFVWHVNGDSIRITSIDDRPLPLFRYRACAGVLSPEVCLCGEKYTLVVYGK